ncbi:IS1595 family transposase [Geoalkalibacter halelectricus]|uniref:IS1595 family transposase n=1 Tax=Geoalkalibacter halelectricus TaxID=2847045 RepID=A0ABY5ZKQ1_9BACT|nr:IS1595 family transposase [Geoalkalibacter halelectricus]UWZ79752.1 IS1595 family transposase [Geoalkalibacter halelectricus]
MNEHLDFDSLNSIEFFQRFPDEATCYEYLSIAKWHSSGFICRKCGHNKYCIGKRPFSRRCLRCKYDESPTAGTAFDKLKFSKHIAFHILFKLSSRKKGISTVELSKEFSLRQKTCWAFKWKIQQAMQSSGRYPLTGEVHVDEFVIGGPEEQKRGRSHGSKKIVIMALEIVEKGVGRAYAQVLDDYSSKSFIPFFEKHISKDAVIKTDEWTGYKPLKKDYPNLKQIPSLSGKGFPDVHIHIMNIKGWLRGIHHHCSKEHLQGYLDEYHFRFNRRNSEGVLFNTLIKRMVNKSANRLNQYKGKAP